MHILRNLHGKRKGGRREFHKFFFVWCKEFHKLLFPLKFVLLLPTCVSPLKNNPTGSFLLLT